MLPLTPVQVRVLVLVLSQALTLGEGLTDPERQVIRGLLQQLGMLQEVHDV